jgi:serine protease AprX
MNHFRPIFAFFCLILIKNSLLGQAENWQKKVNPAIFKSFSTEKSVHFLAVFSQQADVSDARKLRSKTEKATFVFEKLKTTADRSQARIQTILHEKKVFANSFFVANLIAVEADFETMKWLAEQPEIGQILPDLEMKLQFFEEKTTISDRSIEWNLSMIGADSVWKMGFRGQNVTVGGEDTGYDWLHPVLKPHYRGWNGTTADHNYNWHDAIHEISALSGNPNNPCGLDSPEPCDDNSHGTHTMGSMVGDDGQGNQIGVAPEAKFVACRNMERGNGRPSTYIECFQFFLAPTNLAGEKPDPLRAPHVINNSWYCSVSEGCDSTFDLNIMQKVIENLRLSGVVVVVSNGNSGSDCETTTGPPAFFEPSFSVGATTFEDEIAGFSSRGGVDYLGKKYIKPNVSAPGQNVRSCVPNGNFANYSGTSMAGPHVAGLVALIISSNPELAGQVDEIEQIIEQTAVRKYSTQDCSGVKSDIFPNNIYGFGRIDALAAVKMARGLPHFEPTVLFFPNPFHDQISMKMTNVLGDFNFRFFDSAGRLISEKNYIFDRSLTKLFVSDDLPSGIYFYQILSDAGRFSGKLIKI